MIAGTITGALLAAAGLVGPGGYHGRPLPADVIARVNGEPIGREDYQRMLAALAGDRRAELDEAARRHVLDRLIDEELLLQRALELGLAHRDRRARADLTAAVIASVVAEVEGQQPSRAELEAFYAEHRDFFTQPGRLQVRQVFCGVNGTDGAAALERARDAARRLRAGEAFAAVEAAVGDRPLSPLPDGPLPPAKLRDYLGPTGLRAALALGAGEVSEPIRSSDGYRVLQIVTRQADVSPALADIEPQVVAEFRRRAGEAALRAYLDRLRDRAEIIIAELPR